MKYHGYWYVFISLIFFGFATSLFAQNAKTLDTLIVSKDVVVSSSRIPQTAAGSGRNITIIPASTIQNLPVHTVDEVLRYLPGVEVQSRGAFGTQSDFSIRGSTFSQVLVLIDGMRLNDPLTAHFNSNIPVAPSEIERIEVLHGPAAAQYGADAVGGVINIITRSFAQRESGKQTNADVKAGYGQYNLKMGRAGFYHHGNSYRIGGGGMWYETPGQELGKNNKDRFNVRNASVSGGYQLGNGWDLAARTAFDDRDFNAKYFYTASPYDESTEKTTDWWNQVRLTKTFKKRVTTLEGSFKHNIDHYLFNPAFPGNHHITNFLDLQLYQYRTLSTKWEWTYGLQASNRFIHSNDRGRHTDWHYAGFSMIQWHPTQPLTFTGSLRLDHDDNYGTELMPQVSMAYHTGEWVFRTSGGRSIRAADYTERYISTNLQGPLSEGRNIGNPWLKAERSWSGEAGFDVFPLSDMRFSATGFIRASTNLIDYVLTNSNQIRNNSNLQPNTDYLYAENLKNVRTAGVELEFSMSRDLGQNWMLEYTMGYTFASTYNSQHTVSKYISNHARNLINGMISIHKDAFEAGLSGLWKQRQGDKATAINAYMAPSYSVWNLKLGYDVVKNVKLGIEADNLFDAHYQDILGAVMPGRWIMGTVSWQLAE